MKNKKADRRINRIVRELNKDIEKDELWKGRFMYLQIKKRYSNDEGERNYHYLYICIDKETKTFCYCDWVSNWSSDYSIRWRLWDTMNDFIIKDVDPWKDNPTRETTKDYRKISIPKEVFNQRYNIKLKI